MEAERGCVGEEEEPQGGGNGKWELVPVWRCHRGVWLKKEHGQGGGDIQTGESHGRPSWVGGWGKREAGN